MCYVWFKLSLSWENWWLETLNNGKRVIGRNYQFVAVNCFIFTDLGKFKLTD